MTSIAVIAASGNAQRRCSLMTPLAVTYVENCGWVRKLTLRLPNKIIDVEVNRTISVADLPLSSTLRDLRRSNLNNLVRVSGVITRRSGVFPQLKYVKFDCRKCGAVLGPFYQDATREVKISYCANCESKGPFPVNSEQVGVVVSSMSCYVNSS